MKVAYLLTTAALFLATLSFAQSVGINDDGCEADPTSVLDVKSTSKGMLIPRLTYAQRASIVNPAPALLYYQTDNGTGYYFNAGTATAPSWIQLLDDRTQVVRSISVLSPLVVSGGATATPTIALGGPAGGLMYGTGGGVAFMPPAATGQFLTHNGSAPVWSYLGQAGTTVYGTASVALATTATSYTAITGLSSSVSVTANSIVYVSTSGGVVNTSGSAGTYSLTDIALYVDGTLASNGHTQRVLTQNSSLVGAFDHWSFDVTLSLAAGNHTIEVRAKSASPSNAPVSLSGDGTSPYQGKLTVVLLKQ